MLILGKKEGAKMKKGQWFWGALFIAFGVVLLLNNLELTSIDLGDVISKYWPVLLLFWGFEAVFDRKSNTDLLGGGFLFLLGVLLLGRNLNLFKFDFSWLWGAIWPVILILIGVNLIQGAKGEGKTNWAIMGGVDKSKTPWKLEDGNFLALMGGISLDLNTAILEEKEYFLNCTAVMGGIEIKVPQRIKVTCEGNAILGSIEFFKEGSGGIYGSIKAEANPDAKTTVHIYGRVIMGGIEVKAS